MHHPVYRATLFSLILVLGLSLVGMPVASARSSRDVLLEDLTIGSSEADIYHRAERPGAVVRLVPWVDGDGSAYLLAITELGWVYRSGDNPSEWTLVARIFEDEYLDAESLQ